MSRLMLIVVLGIFKCQLDLCCVFVFVWVLASRNDPSRLLRNRGYQVQRLFKISS